MYLSNVCHNDKKIDLSSIKHLTSKNDLQLLIYIWQYQQQFMSQVLLKLYADRLSSLTSTLSYLHEIVGTDQALSLLQDEQLVQYKVDRISELVRQILSSEKEKVIIQLIQRIQSLENRPQQPNNQNELLYFKKRLEQKSQEIEKIRLENSILKQQVDDYKRILGQQKTQFQIYQNKYREIKDRCDKISEEKSLLEKKQAIIGQQSTRQKDLQSELAQIKVAFENEKHNKSKMSDKIEQLQLQLESLSKIIKNEQQPSSKQKANRMQIMKKNLLTLSCELNKTKQMIGIITRYMKEYISQELQKLKKNLLFLPTYIQSQKVAFTRIIIDSYDAYTNSTQNNQNRQEKRDQFCINYGLLQRMDSLQAEMNRFIKVNLI